MGSVQHSGRIGVSNEVMVGMGRVNNKSGIQN